MATTINGSAAAGMAIQTSRIAQRDTEIAVTRLSTGSRINSATDDAAGLSAGASLRSTIMGLNQAVRNVMDFDALLTTADGALSEVVNNLQRVREVALQSANGTLTDADRAGLNQEAEQLLNQISHISQNTLWGDRKLLDGTFTDKFVQAGAQATDNFKITIPSAQIDSIFPYEYTFQNGDFSDTAATQSGTTVSLKGWKIELGQMQLGESGAAGSSSIAGFPTPSDSTPTATNGSQTSAGDDTAPASANFSYSLAGQQAQLISTMTTANGGDIVHGPALVSDSAVYMDTNSSISFRWRAVGGADAYDVYAYLLNVDDGSTVQLLNATGTSTSDTGWLTVNQSIPSAGNYKFVFLSGTFDYSFGRAAGASLYIDDVAVTGGGKPPGAQVRPSDILSISSQGSAISSLSKIDSAIAKVLNSQANIAAIQSRLHFIAEQATRFSIETQRSLSVMTDTNYELEQSAAAKAQLLQQSAMAVLSKAKEESSDALTYIEGNRIKQ